MSDANDVDSEFLQAKPYQTPPSSGAETANTTPRPARKVFWVTGALLVVVFFLFCSAFAMFVVGFGMSRSGPPRPIRAYQSENGAETGGPAVASEQVEASPAPAE